MLRMTKLARRTTVAVGGKVIGVTASCGTTRSVVLRGNAQSRAAVLAPAKLHHAEHDGYGRVAGSDQREGPVELTDYLRG